MKRIIQLLPLAICIISCSESYESIDMQFCGQSEKEARSASDGIYDLLGYGYDITGEYLEQSATRRKVLDVDLFIKNNNERFDNPFIGTITQRSVAGEDAQSFLKQIISDSNFSGSVGSLADKKDKGGFFSATVTAGFKSDNKYSYSSKYSFAKVEVIKKQRQYLLNTDVTTLSDYLSSSFKEDLNKYPADKIVEIYGTHVLTNITIGGTYTAYYKSAIVEESNRSEKTNIVSAGAKYNLSKIGLDANGSWSTTQITETNKKNSNWECNIECKGGATSGTTITLNPNQGPSYSINLGTWTQSVDDTHSKLVDVDWNKTYPIYDLVADPLKKAELQAAVNKYIDSKKIDILKLTPLYAYYSAKHINNSYFTDWKGTYFNTDNYEGVTCYLCVEQVSGTTPLYEYYSSKYINQSLSSIWRGAQSNTDTFQRITGYIYKNQIPGTVPLYEYYSSKYINHSYHSVWKGNRFNTDDFQKIIGYVFPSN